MHLQKNNFDEAGKCLDVGLSYNFKVRERPLYHLIKAKVQKNSGQIEASVGTLRNAIQLPSFSGGYFTSNFLFLLNGFYAYIDELHLYRKKNLEKHKSEFIAKTKVITQ